jgi:apolipoprotein N-acyltransferase
LFLSAIVCLVTDSLFDGRSICLAVIIEKKIVTLISFYWIFFSFGFITRSNVIIGIYIFIILGICVGFIYLFIFFNYDSYMLLAIRELIMEEKVYCSKICF